MIEYQLQRNSRSRNLRMRINAHAEVIVSAPTRMPDHVIEKFILDHADWIIKHQHKIKQKIDFSNPNEMMIFGKTYKKVVHHDGMTADQPVYIRGDQIHIHPVTQTEASVEKTLTNFLKSTAQKYIVPRTQKMAEIMSITYTTLTLRDQKTRWGSCSSTGALNFNWRLVQYPTAVIDYVIVHELAHRKQMNHSDRFWALVAKYDPDYQTHRNWLKKYGSTLD